MSNDEDDTPLYVQARRGCQNAFACLLLLVVLLSLSSPLHASEPLTRLAIVSTREVADLGVLMGASLPQYALLERDELARIGDEQRLAALAAGDGSALGKLAGSDGLLFLSREDGRYRARLTAVHLGFALFDLVFDPDATPEAIVSRLVSHLEPLAGKLALPSEKALPLAVLNLRADISSTDAVGLERNATLLLESRLSQLPQVVLLERRRPAELAFERALTPSSSELLRGVYLIDGSLQLSLSDDGLTATLRVRSPEGVLLTVLSAHGSCTNLAPLIGELLTQIAAALKLPAAHPPANSLSEAREYLHEGIWAHRRKLYPAAIAALDSAELLGETAPDLLAVRIAALAFYASTTDRIVNHSPEIPIPDDHPYPAEAITATLRMMDDFRRYKEAKGQSHLVLFDARRSFEGRTSHLSSISTACALKLLAMLDRTGSPAADRFRSHVRKFIGYAPLENKIPPNVRNVISFAGNLAESKMEEQAYYRALSSDLHWATGRAWSMHALVTPDMFCGRFIIDPAERQAAYTAFWDSLKEHPVAAPHALFHLARWASPEEKEKACRRFYRYLVEHREPLFETKLLPYLLHSAFTIEKERKAKVASPDLIDTLVYLLTIEKPFKLDVYGSWSPDLFPEDRAAELWAAMKGYQQRLRERGEGTGYFTLYNRQFVDRFGNLDTLGGAKHLLVTRYWQPRGLKEIFGFNNEGIIVSPDEVILAGRSGFDPKVYFVSLPEFQSGMIEPPELIQPWMIVTHGRRLFVLAKDSDPARIRDTIWRYDPASKEWKSFPAPKGTHRLHSVGGKLYFTIERFFSSEDESAIGLIDPESGEHRLLASSRRRPAQNPFDDTKAYRIDGLFEGPGGRACAVLDGYAYLIGETSGDWPRLCGAGIQRMTHLGNRTLLQCWSREGVNYSLLLIDPEREAPEALIGPVRTLPLRKKSAPGQQEPDWASSYRWPLGDRISEECYSYVLRGDDLIGIQSQGANGPVLDLLYYRKGDAQPIRIPLHFQMPDAERDAIASILSPSINTFGILLNPRLSGHGSLHHTSTGLVIRPFIHGFWFLPYADLDAYLASCNPAG